MKRLEPDTLAAFRAALEKHLPPSNIVDDESARVTFGHDESDTVEAPPDLVVYATKTADVQAVLALAQGFDVPVTPVGARTGKSGGSLPLCGGVSLSLERMNRIIGISAEDLTCIVQPGVVTGDLMRAVEARGLFYPPDPNSWETCTLGGNVAENAGGPRALKYGVTRDYVLGMEWVLPTGACIQVGKRTIKGVAGYDLTSLFVGSEGTLGVATEITLQLLPKPRAVETALVTFKDVEAAAKAVTAVLAAGLLPRTLELLDDVSIRVLEARSLFTFPSGTGAAVLLEVDGAQSSALLEELAGVDEVLRAHGAVETVVAQGESQREKLWAARRLLSVALRQSAAHKISEDIAVPRSKLARAVAAFKALGKEFGLTVATYGHAGDGNLHANVLFDSPDERPRVDALLEKLMRLTVDLGGTITGEHGVGSAKKAFLPLEQGPQSLALQRALKALVDPKGLLNPGKIFPD